MSLPIKQKEIHTATLEDLMIRRLEKVFDAMDTGNGPLFDRITNSIEMLLRLKPSVFKQLQQFKIEINKSLEVLADDLSKQANSARNEIQRRAIYESGVENLEWEARNDFLEKIIELLGTNQMLPMESYEPAILEQVEEEESEEEEPEEEPEPEPEEEEEIEEEPAPKPKQQSKQQSKNLQQKKKIPRLSIRREEEEFEI